MKSEWVNDFSGGGISIYCCSKSITDNSAKNGRVSAIIGCGHQQFELSQRQPETVCSHVSVPLFSVVSGIGESSRHHPIVKETGIFKSPQSVDSVCTFCPYESGGPRVHVYYVLDSDTVPFRLEPV